MAIFNPNVADTQDPNYLGYSKGTDQIKPNQQWEALFKGVGSVLDAGLKATDTIVKSRIESEVQTGVDRMRNEYTAALEDTAQTSPQDRVSAPMANTLLPPQPGTPPEISGVGTYASNLQNSYLSGKISQTHYEGTLARFAKSVRDRYPGWRDHVDREIAQATSNALPANAYIAGVIGDLNRQATQRKSDVDEMFSIVKSNPGMPRGVEMATAVANGQLDKGTFWKAYVDYKGPVDRASNARTLLAYQKDLSERDKETNVIEAGNIASGIANSHLTSATTVNGVSTPNQIQSFVSDVTSGKKNPTSREIEQWNMSVQQTKVAAQAAIRKQLYDFDPVSKSSIAARIGTNEANRIIADSTKIFDDMGDLIRNKEYGIAFSLSRVNAAMIDRSTNQLYSDPKIGNFMQRLKVIGGLGPEVAEKFIRNVLTSDPRLDANLKDAFLVEAVQMGSGQNGNRSMLQIIQDARARGIVSGNYNAAVMTMVDRITAPDEHPQVKANIARAAFGETGLIGRLPSDDAKYQYWNKFANEGMAQEIQRLSKTPGNEDLWDKYKSWVEVTGAKELIPAELANLRSIQGMRGVRVGWDDQNDRLIIDTSSARRTGALGDTTRDPAGAKEVAMARRTEFRINRVLDSIKPIAKRENTNVDAYLVGTLISLGLDPMRMDTNGLPEQIVQAIKNNRLRQQKPAETQ